MTNDEPTTADEQTIRQIAREEARDIYDIDVEDGDGETWSLFELMDSFGIRRRTALKAMGLMALGSSSTVAVLRAMSGSAQGATGSAGPIGSDTDRPDIYGDSADLNSVSTGRANFDNGFIETGSVDSGPASLGFGFAFGLLVVEKVGSGNAVGTFALNGGADSVDLLSDPNGSFGTAQGASDCNVYHDGSDYVLEITDTSSRADYQLISS